MFTLVTDLKRSIIDLIAAQKRFVTEIAGCRFFATDRTNQLTPCGSKLARRQIAPAATRHAAIAFFTCDQFIIIGDIAASKWHPTQLAGEGLLFAHDFMLLINRVLIRFTDEPLLELLDFP